VRVLCDVNILVRAHERSSGPAREVLLAILTGGHSLLVSAELLIELGRVLRYPRLVELYGLTEEQIYDYIQSLMLLSERVVPDRSILVPMRDPEDIVVLQTALSGDADVICTRDSDFFAPETLEFCRSLGIEVCTDVELARSLLP